jgi:hypothetical protein
MSNGSVSRDMLKIRQIGSCSSRPRISRSLSRSLQHVYPIVGTDLTESFFCGCSYLDMMFNSDDLDCFPLAGPRGTSTADGAPYLSISIFQSAMPG